MADQTKGTFDLTLWRAAQVEPDEDQELSGRAQTSWTNHEQIGEMRWT
ncbi:hypothetical protein HW561_17195 [Rhodobacteraceae bacterium B1Z28]|uniref:Uncharacterized protein n=1 Tax=Ruegeria haliotis TaxID=2747601 RepID=A0ABX2PTR7_9RHOB|nr:hypothetical protein [Ruegeria haliotis]NVO57536.1 hypothetical protein [Ruegeria haliotis]